MEEDPESEWEIQEYSCSKEVETSMMKWILNKGYRIGKKMIITGIAISAAPLVLPPIVVFSAMGVAFSVPSGLVFATYACTNKLMRTLLPTPPSPVLLLEYCSDGDEQVKEEGAELDDDYGRVEKGYYMGEYGDDYGREAEFLVTNADGNINEKGCHLDENIVGEGCYNDENEEEKVPDGYKEEGEGLIMNVVDEKTYITNGNVDEKEIEDVVVPREVVIKEEEGKQIEDMKQGVEMRLGLDVRSITNSDENKEQVQPGEYKQEREASIVDVDVKSYNNNENDDDKEMEDAVLQRETVTKEEKTEQIEDMNSNENNAEVQPDDYTEEGEALIMNVDENIVEKSYNTNENNDKKEMEDDVLQRENVVKEAETEQTQDIKQGVEMRLGLDIRSITNLDENKLEKVQPEDYYKQKEEGSAMNVDETVEEKNNENDDEKEMEDHILQRENVTKEDETEQMEDNQQEVKMRLGIDVGLITNFGSGVDEQGYEEDVGEYLQGDDDSFGEENMGDDNHDMFVESRMDENKNNIQEDEKEEVVEGSTGLLDESASNVASEEVKDVETTEPVIVKEIDSEKLIQNGSNENEHVGEMRHVVILDGGNEDNNFNSIEVEELDLVAREVVGDSEKDVRNIESDEKVIRESMGTQEKTVSDHTSNDGTANVILETKKENLISSNADEKEIGDASASMNFENLEAGGEMKENGADEHVDILALPALRRTLETDNRKVPAENDTKLSTKEYLQDILDDEKIWEKIGAMRAIVGYKVPRQPTCIEELKALYVFTGVEPPVSFNGDSGLDEVNDKLKFLMSIVGVK